MCVCVTAARSRWHHTSAWGFSLIAISVATEPGGVELTMGKNEQWRENGKNKLGKSISTLTSALLPSPYPRLCMCVHRIYIGSITHRQHSDRKHFLSCLPHPHHGQFLHPRDALNSLAANYISKSIININRDGRINVMDRLSDPIEIYYRASVQTDETSYGSCSPSSSSSCSISPGPG